jgi:hypothetical protein
MEPPPIPGGNGGSGEAGPVTATVAGVTLWTAATLYGCDSAADDEVIAMAGVTANTAKAKPKRTLGDWVLENIAIHSLWVTLALD